jgi:hypothetical protein
VVCRRLPGADQGKADLIFSNVTEQLEFDQDPHIVISELFADSRRG